VVTVTPEVTSSTGTLPANATTITINGAGFDPIAANNTVTFNDGAVGTVTKANSTSLMSGRNLSTCAFLSLHAWADRQ